MCGLAGMVRLDGGHADHETLVRMAAQLLHRGPDDAGYFVAGPVGFGFRRLSILDLSDAAHQPMRDMERGLTLVFNGEIWNYIELREELRGLGHVFTSTGDTQVLLAAYRQWGRDCLPKLNGMWAFLIHDSRTGTVFGSRDRFGIKPLYFYRTPGVVLLASEIKAIRNSGLYRGGPNWSKTSQFLHVGRLDQLPDNGETFYSGIEQVPAGSAFALSSDGHWEAWPFWSISSLERESVEDPAGQFGALLADSVRLRLRSDVPVGISLSGGIDSVSIAALVARSGTREGNGTPPGRFTGFAFMASEFDESAHLESIRRQTGMELHRVNVDPLRLWDQLPRVLWYQDEPVHSLTALVGFEIYRAAAERGIRVVLNGQGADEVLAGYPFFFGHYWRTLIASGQLRRARREIGDYCRVHGGDAGARFRRALRQATRSALRDLLPVDLVRTQRQARDGGHPWFTRDFTKALPSPDADDVGNSLDAGLCRATERVPLPLYLRVEDRNAMAHSVEVRVPFLDYRLVSLAFSLPLEWKMRGPWSKYVLREAMRGVIPESVRTRTDKMGFPTPAGLWFRGSLYDRIQDLLSSGAVRERGIYNVSAIRRDLEKHRVGEHDVSSALFNVAQFERWIELGDGRERGGQHSSDAMAAMAKRRASDAPLSDMISSRTPTARVPVGVADSRSTTPSPPPRPTAPGGSHPATEPERRHSGGGPSAPSPDR